MITRRTQILPFLIQVIIAIQAGGFLDDANAYKMNSYTTRSSSAWPGTGDWLELTRNLSSEAELFGPFGPSDYEEQCGPDEIDVNDPFEIAMAGEGICMQHPSCANQFCLKSDTGDNYGRTNDKDIGNFGDVYFNNKNDDLPAYSLMAKTELDIVKGMEFANKHNIQVMVKSSGHSYSGASTAKDSLLIWLAHYPHDSTIIQNYTTQCGDVEPAVITVNAGQNFQSIADAVGDDYHFVSASEPTISASGGWIQGNGLSYTSRHYGLGVDNVVDFRVVLPSGVITVANRCSNADLFWALRGGGGGTFGVVTQMHYKLHPPTPIVHSHFSLGKYSNNSTYVSKFLRYWIDNAPTMDTRLGGKFSTNSVDLYFAGNSFAAENFGFKEFKDWVQYDLDIEGGLEFYNSSTTVYDSWSKVLPLLEENTVAAWSTEATFARLVPEDMVTSMSYSTLGLLESLAFSDSLGSMNMFLGGKINEVDDMETSVNPALRESTFLLTSNEYGYRKLRKELPNDLTGTSKNHHGGLEPEWRTSIWGEHYADLLEIKQRVDPMRILNCYQSVGYDGDEVDYDNVAFRMTAPTGTPIGLIRTSAAAASLITLRFIMAILIVGVTFATTC